MAGNGAEKRKADEMMADSVEVPLAELQELAAKGGEQRTDHARTYMRTYAHESTRVSKCACERHSQGGSAHSTTSTTCVVSPSCRLLVGVLFDAFHAKPPSAVLCGQKFTPSAHADQADQTACWCIDRLRQTTTS